LSQTSDGKKQTLERPRSRVAHTKVLDAAAELFAERGIDGTSIDSIAASSGVSKATIYKHWSDKKALCLEVLARVHGLDRESPTFDSGDLLRDLIDFLNHKPPEELAGLRDRLMPHLVAYASSDREFGKMWRSRVMEPGRAKAVELMQRGIEQGVFPHNLDIQLGIALLIGPMAYKHIFRGIAPVPENLAEEVARAFWRAFAIPSRAVRGRPKMVTDPTRTLGSDNIKFSP
jgi:AcrR family transcriptional regulator